MVRPGGALARAHRREARAAVGRRGGLAADLHGAKEVLSETTGGFRLQEGRKHGRHPEYSKQMCVVYGPGGEKRPRGFR
jgi:hypothetical protein